MGHIETRKVFFNHRRMAARFPKTFSESQQQSELHFICGKKAAFVQCTAVETDREDEISP